MDALWKLMGRWVFSVLELTSKHVIRAAMGMRKVAAREKLAKQTCRKQTEFRLEVEHRLLCAHSWEQHSAPMEHPQHSSGLYPQLPHPSLCGQRGLFRLDVLCSAALAPRVCSSYRHSHVALCIGQVSLLQCPSHFSSFKYL